MQVTLDAGTVLMGIFALLFAIIEIFVMLWIRSVNQRLSEQKEVSEKLRSELSSHREAVARECVPRSEQHTLREEFRNGLESIDRKLGDINSKLDRKQDKA